MLTKFKLLVASKNTRHKNICKETNTSLKMFEQHSVKKIRHKREAPSDSRMQHERADEIFPYCDGKYINSWMNSKELKRFKFDSL